MERKRPRRTREDWEALVEKQSVSGQTQAKWCNENGINYKQFVKNRCQWLQQNHERPESKARQQTSWLKVSGTSEPRPTQQYRIKLGRCEITVPAVFDETELKRIVRAVSESC